MTIMRNDELHLDLNLKFLKDVIKDYTMQHEKRQLKHVTMEALQLLDMELDIRRLSHLKP